MKRFLALFSLCISVSILSVWVITTPETLPTDDTKWHIYKRKLLMKLLSCKRDKYSNNHVPLCETKIDVVFLCTEKDLQTVNRSIDAVKGLVMHPINKIYLICPESNKLRGLAHEKGCEFVEETKVIPHLAKDKNVSGHLKQQLIKLNANVISTADYFLVVDADTILLQTQIFLRDDKAVFNAFNKYNLSCKLTVESLLKLDKYYNFDFSSHHMLFDKSKLQAMKDRLQNLYELPWQDVLNNLDTSSQVFSEYEMYANFVLTFFPNEATIVHGKNLQMPADRISGVEWQRGFLSGHYKSLSFNHSVTTESRS